MLKQPQFIIPFFVVLMLFFSPLQAIRLMKGIFAANREKQQKEKLKRRGQHKVFMAKMSKLEAERDTRVKEQRKKVYRLLGQEEKRKQRAAGKNRK